MFPAGFSIAERPHIPKAMGSAPFDDEGVATRDRELIVDGVLTGYILSSYSARKLGMQTTGNAGGAKMFSHETAEPSSRCREHVGPFIPPLRRSGEVGRVKETPP